jgi:hypothetical protein
VDNGIPNRSAQAELGGRNEISVREEIADRLRSSSEAARKNLKKCSGTGEEALSQREINDLEKRIVFEYAKEKALWVKDLYSLGDPLPGGGNENTLAINKNTGALYKSNNLFNSKDSISTLLEQIKVHNLLFPHTKYEIAGFTGIDNGESRPPYIEVILKQEYIPNATEATPQEIADYMNDIGFEQLDNHRFTNGQYTISDLRPRNVLKDDNGIIYVVDDIVS